MKGDNNITISLDMKKEREDGRILIHTGFGRKSNNKVEIV